MTRYFKPDGDEGGWVVYAATEDHDIHECQRLGQTEVRVVPMDSVVIDGPLPEVTRVGDGWYRVGVVEVSPAIAAKAWERAREYAAIAAAYERDHAIDEAQVKALAEDLAMEWGLTISESEVLAIHLIARGWVKGGDPR